MPAARSIDEVIDSFNKTINALLQTLIKKIPPNDITMQSNVERLKKRLILARKEMGSGFVIENGAAIILKFKDKILERNEEFFTRLDIRAHFGDKLGKEAESVCELIDYIKLIYNNSKRDEKDKLYGEVCNLLLDVVDFELLRKIIIRS